MFKLFVLGNRLDNDDTKYIAGILKVNTTLTCLDVGCESFFLFFCFFFRQRFLLSDNEIGDAGVSYIAKALKLNNTLYKINFYCE